MPSNRCTGCSSYKEATKKELCKVCNHLHYTLHDKLKLEDDKKENQLIKLLTLIKGVLHV